MHSRRYFKELLGENELPSYTICLTPRQRETFYLFYCRGMTAKEVGKELGIAPPTVFVSVINARKRIHEHLKLKEQFRKGKGE